MRLLAESTIAASVPARAEERFRPTACTRLTKGPKSHAGSHSFQGRKGSAMREAAKKTQASTTQLKMVPK